MSSEALLAQVRAASIHDASRRGIEIPKTLPLLDNGNPRASDEVTERLLCLNAVAAAAYGFPKDRAFAWLKQERLQHGLTASEQALLDGHGDATPFRLQVEGAWALAWVLNLVPRMDYWSGADPNFVRLLPDLKSDEPTVRLRQRAQMRCASDLMAALDLGYCLHWAIVEAGLQAHSNPSVTPYVVVERRRALEWVLGDQEWDAIALDT